MRAILQRVSAARVEVDGKVVGEIGPGLLVLLGIGRGDGEEDVEFLLRKILHLRVFSDEQGRFQHDLVETDGGLLIVPQFTLYGDSRRGRRPSFDQAASVTEGRHWYERFIERARQAHRTVQTGVFQAAMSVHLVNEGPVTLWLDSRQDETSSGRAS